MGFALITIISRLTAKHKLIKRIVVVLKWGCIKYLSIVYINYSRQGSTWPQFEEV